MTHPVVKRENRFMWLALGLIFLALYMGTEDDRVQKAEAKAYAENVCIWKQQVANGVVKEQADGHPDYEKRGIVCEGTTPQLSQSAN